VELTAEEGRVLGALVEKELVTPQAYPLTDNALVAACNQTTSRDPVVSYDVPTVRLAVRSLREQGLLRTVHRTGERSDKHRHELATGLGLSVPDTTVLALLLLRGPQTAAELRARAERMHPFGSLDEVEQVLSSLAEREEPLVRLLEREPGRREARWVQLLTPGGGATATSDVTSGPAVPPAAGPAAVPAAVPAAIPTAVPASGHDQRLAARVAALESEVAQLRAIVEELRDERG
jgi:uncharacterized protein YceH (UPF0502 family)